jgi:hypothetical protein
MTRSSGGLDLKEYLYLDEPGIESLYAQTVDYLEVEKNGLFRKGPDRQDFAKTFVPAFSSAPTWWSRFGRFRRTRRIT